jgi:UDP-glucose:glycoprotein glucosyltransferase
MFSGFHQELSRRATDGLISYRVRYRPSNSGNSPPLFVNGYGVELALKRTDYIVIDDRDAEQSSLKEKDAATATLLAEDLTEDSTADLRPLSSSEVSMLGVNAASFVMSSADPFDTLLKLSQDFPKHSSAIAAHNATTEFLTEFRANRAYFLPAGYNVMWINGVQMDPRHIDAFSLLGHLRHERKLIGGLRTLGLSSREAVNLLSDPEVTKSQVADDVQRYYYRDDIEGGGIILWLNDLERDRRYEEWPRNLNSVRL